MNVYTMIRDLGELSADELQRLIKAAAEELADRRQRSESKQFNLLEDRQRQGEFINDLLRGRK